MGHIIFYLFKKEFFILTKGIAISIVKLDSTPWQLDKYVEL